MGRLSLFQAAILSARRGVVDSSTAPKDAGWVGGCCQRGRGSGPSCLLMLLLQTLLRDTKLTLVDVQHDHLDLRALEGDHGHGGLREGRQ